MKKILFSFLIILGTSLTMYGQSISENALGIRLGDGDGFGTEISYQRGLGDNNRLELDLGYESGPNFDGFKATGLYQWVWNIEDGFNWYAGAGGGIGTISIDNDFVNRNGIDDNSELFLLAAGQIGIEYNFDFPLIVSLDLRPEIYFGGFRDDFDRDIAFGVRYQF